MQNLVRSLKLSTDRTTIRIGITLNVCTTPLSTYYFPKIRPKEQAHVLVSTLRSRLKTSQIKTLPVPLHAEEIKQSIGTKSLSFHTRDTVAESLASLILIHTKI
jgi:hypothetical protein